MSARPGQNAILALEQMGAANVAAEQKKMTPAGLEPAIRGSVGRCLIHWATGPAEALLNFKHALPPGHWRPSARPSTLSGRRALEVRLAKELLARRGRPRRLAARAATTPAGPSAAAVLR